MTMIIAWSRVTQNEQWGCSASLVRRLTHCSIWQSQTPMSTITTDVFSCVCGALESRLVVVQVISSCVCNSKWLCLKIQSINKVSGWVSFFLSGCCFCCCCYNCCWFDCCVITHPHPNFFKTLLCMSLVSCSVRRRLAETFGRIVRLFFRVRRYHLDLRKRNVKRMNTILIKRRKKKRVCLTLSMFGLSASLFVDDAGRLTCDPFGG